ncbi:Ada metal-binding domain-containing protein [Bacillus subtilis]|uniref:Ada metal-binding domain-containing protein n=1 Tax=Bacillus subtilis TaxID=1423 RepID=UPI0034535022
MCSGETEANKRYTLIGSDLQLYHSNVPGTLGGNRRGKLYGRLDCPSALRAIARGGYVKHRVFFKDEKTAIAAGYRPCAVCLSEKYAKWKANQDKENENNG